MTRIGLFAVLSAIVFVGAGCSSGSAGPAGPGPADPTLQDGEEERTSAPSEQPPAKGSKEDKALRLHTAQEATVGPMCERMTDCAVADAQANMSQRSWRISISKTQRPASRRVQERVHGGLAVSTAAGSDPRVSGCADRVSGLSRVPVWRGPERIAAGPMSGGAVTGARPDRTASRPTCATKACAWLSWSARRCPNGRGPARLV